MSSSGTLLIICCDESDTRIDPSRHFNLSANTSVIKTAGGRTSEAIDSLYSVDQSTPISMIIVMQHTDCASSAGTVDTNVRDDIGVLKDSPYVRNDIQVIGYVLDVGTGQLREVNIPQDGQDEEARRRAVAQLDDFGPFWN